MNLEDLAAALADRYTIVREIGHGGMATVYLAVDVKHDREVALKVLRPELAALLGAERFLNEIRITARLDHPHILTLIDSGTADGALYYVAPFVRGESLRERLVKEGQLSLEDALRITTQVASALDYSHRQGVVHRDIKPENILLQEGEVLLADFGIALAVTQAGGPRLTETGLSLGTPQYMSPEQALGGRTLDARSDVYSLGAVLYEMLAGDPPHTGSTVQAMIAKLVAERPTSLRALRDTVPEGVDRAVMKALAKLPADRFPSAGRFASSLNATSALDRPPRSRRRPLALGALGVAAVAGLGFWIARAPRERSRGARAALHDRMQLTTSGRVSSPAISADGKQLAYVSSDCGVGGCKNAIELQDVGQTATRTVLEGAAALSNLSWSPDRRNVIANGYIQGLRGWHLVSTSGVAPRFLVREGGAAFYGGDSLLVTPPARPGLIHWIRVAGTDGVARDSIRIEGAADALCGAIAVPQTSWIITCLARGSHAEILVVGRQGRVASRMPVEGTWDFRASTDALWLRSLDGGPALLRIPFDPATGRLSAAVDTLSLGGATAFDVTADGGTLVADEGIAEFDVYVLGFREAMRGEYTADKRLLHSSSPIRVGFSPDGARVAFTRFPAGTDPIMSVRALAGGAESRISTRGLADASWFDSVTMKIGEADARGDHLSLVDVRTGARRAEFSPAEPPIVDWDALPGGGWVWITADGQSIRTQLSGEIAPRTIPKPPWYAELSGVIAAPDGRHVAFVGRSATSADSLTLSVLSLADSTIVRWVTLASGADVSVQPLADGSFVLWTTEQAGTRTLYRVRGPGRVERLGLIPRRVAALRVSPDLTHAWLKVIDRHADAYLWMVSRP